ncbi:hypothetical protein BDB00DRAFT_367419 [Zychaea mexicana]|uniref:uncharacterized protein n=1 Tax=Zychaea mexicana TaxID=64656 RepID=UPI0022FEF52B|nr:uncharacterized protein BDB00DRAFT_367419 [Zychaea mexicana]KAI9493576.1 hypothetical protein BDB00DRAFT_367419 [Zychaea mexicana]
MQSTQKAKCFWQGIVPLCPHVLPFPSLSPFLSNHHNYLFSFVFSYTYFKNHIDMPLYIPLGAAKPWVDILLPQPIVLTFDQIIPFYLVLLSIDYTMLRKESLIPLTPVQFRVILGLVHAAIPLYIVSTSVVANLFFAAIPWFFVSYGASLPLERITLCEAYRVFMAVVTDHKRTIPVAAVGGNEVAHQQQQKQQRAAQNRWHGVIKVARGTSKLIFLHQCIEPWLPANNAYILSLPWFDWRSLTLTMLYGTKGYCFLGIVDIGMGLEELVLAEPMIDLFNSPIISSSPRDFWSRRWNRAVRNLLHRIVFMRGKNDGCTSVMDGKKKKKQHDMKKKDSNNTLLAVGSRNIMGFMAFVVSGVFHELIIASMFRRFTLENLVFFTLHGVAVWIQLTVRDWAKWSKDEPHGASRLICVALHLMFLAVTGRFFLAPYLRYYCSGCSPIDLYKNSTTY